MIFPKIKESIKNSGFFRKNNSIPIDFYSNYKKIKNNYIESKNEIKNKVKNDLIDFIDYFLMYNVDDVYIEDYVLDLIHEFGFDNIFKIILDTNFNIIDKIENFKSIQLLKGDINEENIIYEHCVPEYYVKNKDKLDKNKIKNRHMKKFFNNLDYYQDLLILKMNFKIDIMKHKYFIWIKNSNKNLDLLFIDAIENKNIKCAKKLLENGANIHKNDDYALRLSSQHGYIDVVKFLIENGADIHANNDDALIESSTHGRIDVVKFLVENGSNIHADDDLALRWSSHNGHVDVVKFLIENGADIHADDDLALRWGSRYGHIEVVKILIENGANIHTYDDCALRWSSQFGYIEVVKFLIQSDINYFKANQSVIPIIQRHELNDFFNNLINDA
jgi:ankyrin repeat protein